MTRASASARARMAAVGVLLGLLVTACGGVAAPLALGRPSADTPTATAAAIPAATAGATAAATASTATPAPPPTPSATPCAAQSVLALWTTQRLAWQVITVPAQMSSLGSVSPEVASGAGGILLFGATAPDNLAQQLARLASTSPGGIAPMVMSDVEGGDIERAANLLGSMPSARRMAQTMSAPQIEAYARTMGLRMRAIGLTMDLAPVLDLDAGAGPTLADPDGTRSFSADPKIAAADSTAFAAGLADAGLAAAAKHFPGLHGAGDNTDLVPAQTSSWSSLQNGGLVPFESAIAHGVPAVMLSNASVPGLSSLPSTISAPVIAALRDQLGFKGLILTDSLSAGAISKIGLTVAAAATDSLIAGADMVLYNSAANDVAADAAGTVAAIAAAVASGRLPRSQLINSVSRVLVAKHVDLCAGT